MLPPHTQTCATTMTMRPQRSTATLPHTPCAKPHASESKHASLVAHASCRHRQFCSVMSITAAMSTDADGIGSASHLLAVITYLLLGQSPFTGASITLSTASSYCFRSQATGRPAAIRLSSSASRGGSSSRRSRGSRPHEGRAQPAPQLDACHVTCAQSPAPCAFRRPANAAAAGAGGAEAP